MSQITAEAVRSLREKSGAGMMLCKKALTETQGDIDAAIEYLRKQGQQLAGKRADRAAKQGLVGTRIGDKAAVMVELNSETDFVAKNPEFKALLDSLLDVAAAGQPATLDDLLSAPFQNGNAKTVSDLVTEKVGVIGEKIEPRRYALVPVDTDTKVFSYLHMGGKIGILLRLKGDRKALEHNSAQALGKDLAMQVAAAKPLWVERSEAPKAKVEAEASIYREVAAKEGKPEKILDRIVQGKLEKFYGENCLLEQPFVKDPDTKVKKRIESASSEAGGPLSVVDFTRFALGEEDK